MFEGAVRKSAEPYVDKSVKPRCEPWALGWGTPGTGGRGAGATRLYGDLVWRRVKSFVLDNLKNLYSCCSCYILSSLLLLLFGISLVYLRRLFSSFVRSCCFRIYSVSVL